MAGNIKFVQFPKVDDATEDGLLAMGGNLNTNTLVSAYAQGIFPWYSDDQPILWWSPNPRMVLYPAEVKVSRSLAKKLKKGCFTVTCNLAFEEVISACALRGQLSPRMATEDTWITADMNTAYIALHEQGYAHSIEVWRGTQLVGGLYGLALGHTFFGESMFSRVSDASKVGLVCLCQHLSTSDYKVIDCQVTSSHLSSLGAVEIERNEFLNMIDGIDINEPNLNFSSSFKHAFPDGVITSV